MGLINQAILAAISVKRLVSRPDETPDVKGGGMISRASGFIWTAPGPRGR